MAKPTLLLYDPLPSPWAPKLKQYCAVQGLRLRPVEPADLWRTVGGLAGGAAGAAPVQEAPPAPSPAIPEPVILFCSLSDGRLEQALAALRRMGASGVLKAVLTPTNAGWTLPALYAELCRERAGLG